MCKLQEEGLDLTVTPEYADGVLYRFNLATEEAGTGLVKEGPGSLETASGGNIPEYTATG